MSLRVESVHPDGHEHLGSLLLDACLRFRDHLALLEMDRRRTRSQLSYDDVRCEALRLGGHFARLGLEPGDRVAIVMANQPAWLISALAVFRSGLTLVPIDPKLAASEQRALLEHCEPAALVTEAHHWRRLEHGGELPGSLSAIVTDWVGPIPDRAAAFSRWEDDSNDAATPEPVARTRDDLACIVYSSGTGGRPKGCMLTHGAYLAQLAALMELYPMRADERYFSVLPTNHAIDFLAGFIGPFVSGAAVVHQRTLRPEFLLDTLRTQRITRMAVVPLLLEAFERTLDEQLGAAKSWQQRALGLLTDLNAALTRRVPRHGLSRRLLKPVHDGFGGHLELLFAGGAHVDERRARRFYELGIPVVIGYGLTECTTVATLQDLAPFRADSVGRAVPGVELKIHQPDADGRGEVWIRGETVMKGYLDDPELTAETLIEDGDAGPWLRTGDVGWLDASRHLHLVGPTKNMIVTAGGKNIYPEDLEAAFGGVGASELVIFAESFVWGRPTEDAPGSQRLVVVAAPDDGVGWDVLEQRIAARNLKQPPARRVHALVRAPEPFPRTTSLKVKRDELARSLAKQVGHSDISPLAAGDGS